MINKREMDDLFTVDYIVKILELVLVLIQSWIEYWFSKAGF